MKRAAILGSVLTGVTWVTCLACASTTLETPSDHPANPTRPPPPEPTLAAALAPNFDPFSAYPANSAAPSAAIYTCPMHPEIQRNAPGNCPICGMKLVPKEPPTHSHPPAP